MNENIQQTTQEIEQKRETGAKKKTEKRIELRNTEQQLEFLIYNYEVLIFQYQQPFELV